MNIICLCGLFPFFLVSFFTKYDLMLIPIIVFLNGVLFHGIEDKATYEYRKIWDILWNVIFIILVNLKMPFIISTRILTSLSLFSYSINTKINSDYIHVLMVQFSLFIALCLYIFKES